jgi:hypothetical protein
VAVIPESNASGFAPIALNPQSYNQDVVVERGATPPPPLLTTASMDAGKANTGFSWYEVGFDADAPDTGLPAAGSTITSETFADHSFGLASSYTNNNAVIIDSVSTNATLTVSTPAAFSGLSFLHAAGNGSATVRVIVTHADGTAETNSFVSGDWFNGTNVAVTANGRVDVQSRALDSVDSGNPRPLFQ